MISQKGENGKGAARLLRALSCSVCGLKAAFYGEAAFRQQVWAAAVLLPLSFWVAPDVYGWVMLNASVLLVLLAELLNSAIEALADRITLLPDSLIGKAKDMGSAAVLLAMLMCLMVWLGVGVSALV